MSTTHIIRGSTAVVEEMFIDLQQAMDLIFAGYIEKYNKYGFVQINFYDEYKNRKYCKKPIKRHVTHSEDVALMWNKFPIKDYYVIDDVIRLSPTTESEEVYFIITADDCGMNAALKFDRTQSMYTSDLTEAWFTFDKEQASRLAAKLTRKYLKLFVCKAASDVVVIDDYERC